MRANITANRSSYRIENRLQEGIYPQEYFEPGNKTWEDIKANTFARGFENYDMDDLIHPFLAKKKSATSTLIATEKTKDKSLSYRNPAYERELAIRGAYLDEAEERIVEDSRTLCETLLTTE